MHLFIKWKIIILFTTSTVFINLKIDHLYASSEGYWSKSLTRAVGFNSPSGSIKTWNYIYIKPTNTINTTYISYIKTIKLNSGGESFLIGNRTTSYMYVWIFSFWFIETYELSLSILFFLFQADQLTEEQIAGIYARI